MVFVLTVQSMAPGTSGQPGVPALLLAPTGRSSAHGSVTALLMEVQSAGETRARFTTASLETAQVCPYLN